MWNGPEGRNKSVSRVKRWKRGGNKSASAQGRELSNIYFEDNSDFAFAFFGLTQTV